MLLFTKPRQGREPGARGPMSGRVKGARKDKDSSPGSRLPLRTPWPASPRGTRGPRPSPELHRRHYQPRNEPGFPLDAQRHTRSLPSARRVRAGAAARRPRTPPDPGIRALTCLRSRRRPAQPPRRPQPARRPSAPFSQLRPRPAPGRWDWRPRRNLGAASLNSREPSLLGFSVLGPSDSALTSNAPQPEVGFCRHAGLLPHPSAPGEFLIGPGGVDGRVTAASTSRHFSLLCSELLQATLRVCCHMSHKS